MWYNPLYEEFTRDIAEIFYLSNDLFLNVFT